MSFGVNGHGGKILEGKVGGQTMEGPECHTNFAMLPTFWWHLCLLRSEHTHGRINLMRV